MRQLPEDSNNVPDRIETQTAQLDNLAVVDSSQGIVFDLDADHEETEERLTDLLPLPFYYFAQKKRESGKQSWFLVTAVKGKLVIVPSEGSSGPDGASLNFNKGTGTTGFRSSKIFIGMVSCHVSSVLLTHLHIQSLGIQFLLTVCVNGLPAPCRIERLK